jgi:hypothetical protein
VRLQINDFVYVVVSTACSAEKQMEVEKLKIFYPLHLSFAAKGDRQDHDKITPTDR